MCYTGISKNENFFDLVILEFFGEALTAHSGSDVKSRVQKIFSNAVTFHIPTEQRKDFRRLALLSKVSLRCFCISTYRPWWYISAPLERILKKLLTKVFEMVYNVCNAERSVFYACKYDFE